MIMLHN